MLLLCDLDGTLVDRDAAFRSWCDDLATRHGARPEFLEWVVAEDRGGAWERRELFASIRQRLRLDPPIEQLTEEFMAEFTSRFRCDAGVEDTLAKVKAAGHAVAIVTNGGPTQMDKIKAAGLDAIADAICISSVENCWKPDPRLLEIAAARAGADLVGAWMIGDAIADIGAAVAARVDSVWLRPGRSWDHGAFAPTVEADDFREAVGVVFAAWTGATR